MMHPLFETTCSMVGRRLEVRWSQHREGEEEKRGRGLDMSIGMNPIKKSGPEMPFSSSLPFNFLETLLFPPALSYISVLDSAFI